MVKLKFEFDKNESGTKKCAFCKTAYTPILNLTWYNDEIHLCAHCLTKISHATVDLTQKLVYEESMNHVVWPTHDNEEE